MDQAAFQSLVVYINSKNEKDRFLEKIDLVVRQSVQTEFAHSVSATFNTLEQSLLSQLNIQSKTDLTNLAHELEQTQVMKIYTAITPSGNTEISLSNLLRKNTTENFFIQFTERPSLVAGAVIEYKGKVFDFSLQNRLGEIK